MQSALQALAETRDQHQKHMGLSQRKRRNKKLCLGVTAANILMEADMTIDFDPTSKAVKHSGAANIWEWIAFQYPVTAASCGLKRIERPTLMQQGESATHYSRKVRQAFKALQGMMEHMYQDQYPLYVVPRTNTGKGIEIITLHSTYEVYPGVTVRDAEHAWHAKRSKDWVYASIKRELIYMGENRDYAQVLRRTITEATREISIQRRLPGLTLDEASDS